MLLLAPGLLAWMPARAAEPAADIQVLPGDWGEAEVPEIATLLQAVADTLITRPAQRPRHPIVVSYAAGDPLTLYAKGSQGEYKVHLSARDRRWSQYAYQFGHELCHILAGYDAGHQGGRGEEPAASANPHQWFEEALCETAALYTLRTLAATWEAAPPYPGWEDYSPALQSYAERLLDEPHRRLPQEMPLSAWLRAKEPGLRNHPYLREENEVVANQLLPLFEEQPQGWQALASLNRDQAARPADDDVFRHLQRWYDNAPAGQRAFLRNLLAHLGVAPAPGADSPTREPLAPSPEAQPGIGAAGPAGS
ncbi:MAG: hypothetical protein KGN39_03080 [Betaproteobacteria bacterium]|nr:hypothetical protein [Betaproteobacteria bacterium]